MCRSPEPLRSLCLAPILTLGLALSACGDPGADAAAKAEMATTESAASTDTATARSPQRFNIGREATVDEIAGWNIDVRPDGLGLPPGEGSVEDGEMLYEDKCASCHGVFGEGEGRWPKLSGGMGTLTHERPDKTVGSYWPYASTLWDYIHRAMPFTAPQSLSPDETYAITAYVLYLNEVIDEDFVLSRDNFSSIQLPNWDGFFVDDRPDVSNSRCMNNCVDPATIELVETIAGITPTTHLRGDGTDARAYAEPGEKPPIGAEVADHPGKSTYDSACKLCQSSGVAGAPITGDTGDWKARLEQGQTLLYRLAIEGFQGTQGVMPARGGQGQLSDEAVRQAVDYILELSR